MNQKNDTSESGLSLIETIVAIAVLSLGLFGGIMLAQYSITVMKYSRNLFEAKEFSQEGIELVRAKRDTNWLEGNKWDTGLAQGYYVARFSAIGKRMELVPILPGSAFSETNLEATLGDATRIFHDTRNVSMPFFTQDSSLGVDATTYYRQIEIVDDPVISDKKIVRSDVVFPYKGSYRVVDLEEEIYNWK